MRYERSERNGRAIFSGKLKYVTVWKLISDGEWFSQHLSFRGLAEIQP